MDFWGLLAYWINTYAPGRMALVVATAAAVKGAVDLIKKFRPTWRGNVVQTIAAVVSLFVTVGQFWAAGAFRPVTQTDVFACLAVAALAWAAAIGINEIFKDRNPDNN